jgi:5-methyltetrahydrofolate--homocysteine methyltransferase
VKIEPNYSEPGGLCPNASRAVGGCEPAEPEPAPAFVARIDKEYEIARDQHARKQPRPSRCLAHARANRHQLDCGYEPPAPREPGVQTSKTCPLGAAPYIDWTPFFQSWELAGSRHPGG